MVTNLQPWFKSPRVSIFDKSNLLRITIYVYFYACKVCELFNSKILFDLKALGKEILG
jgi:hypothetical protein